MKLLGWIIFALAALLLILFAVSNRESVAVGLWPLPVLVQMPLYLLLLAVLVLGFVVGQLVAWIAGAHWRREARRSRDRIAALESELAAARASDSGTGAPLVALPR
jgi:uncharacterized integral membrane protein